MTLDQTSTTIVANPPFGASVAVLDEAEGDVEGLPTRAVPDAFAVRDLHTANRVVKRISECRDYVDRVTAWAAAEIRRAEREEQFLWSRFGSQLEAWAAEEIRKQTGRRKSVHLPAGTVGFRAGAAKLVVKDEALLVAWCREHLPEAIEAGVEAAGVDAERLVLWQRAQCPGARCTVRVAKNLVRAHLRNTGEVPEGAERIDGAQKFYLR